MLASLFKCFKRKPSSVVQTSETVDVTPQPRPLSDTEKNGYRTLAALCLAKEKQDEMAVFIDNLNDFEGDDGYFTTLNYVMDWEDDHDLFFIMAVDWKEEVDTLEWRIDNAVKNNFGLCISLPDPQDYSDTPVYNPKVFPDYEAALSKHDLKLGFIDTQADEYVFFVHRTADQSAVEEAVRQIGYRYK